MNIFGVGIPEILVVLLLAALIFGPGKLPEIAGQFGRAIRELREYARDFRDEYLTDFEEVREELIEQRFELQQIDADIRADVEQAGADLRGAVRDAEVMTEDAIATARDGGGADSARSSATALDRQVDQQPAEEPNRAERTARRVRRRPIVRPRRVAGAAVGSDDEAGASTNTEPVRPSNIISLNRRRRELEHDAQ